MASDVCCGNVCQVITAQEVDKSFATLLQNANLPGGSASAVADADKRKDFYGSGRVWTHQSWIVASGVEKEKTCIVAGRASIFSGIKIVEWHKTEDGRHKNHGKENSAFPGCWSLTCTLPGRRWVARGCGWPVFMCIVPLPNA